MSKIEQAQEAKPNGEMPGEREKLEALGYRTIKVIETHQDLLRRINARIDEIDRAGAEPGAVLPVEAVGDA